MSMRSAASCCQPLQESVVPRGARMTPRVVGVSVVESAIAPILLHLSRAGTLACPALAKGGQARVPVSQKFDTWFRFTECYRKTKGHGLTIHDPHLPADCDTGKAMLNLKP